MPEYNWICTHCGKPTSAAVQLTKGQKPPADAVDQTCPICQDTTPQRADLAPERRKVER